MAPICDRWQTLRSSSRVMMYSHDNFGLGHLRRCRTIAHALVERFDAIQVLIVSGSAIGDAFDFRDQVEYLQIPSIVRLMNDDHASIVKLMSGFYTPPEDTELCKVLQRRIDILLDAARHFRPSIFYADYSPLGLRGELVPALEYLKKQDTVLVLGFRDVLDSPQKLKSEWGHLNDLSRAAEMYDAVWVFGPEDFYDPLVDLDAPKALYDCLVYTGFLHCDSTVLSSASTRTYPENALLITAGGGGDGARLFHQVIDAYACDPSLTREAIIVLGPVMHPTKRQEIHHKAAPYPSLHLVDFEPHLEPIIQSAVGVISMGGYNTFCEILSFDKRAIIVPRTLAREEQLIRTRRVAELGLVDMLLPEECENAPLFAAALHRLPMRLKPSEANYNVSLGGLEVVVDLVREYLGKFQMPKLPHVDSGISLNDMMKTGDEKS
ncbi:putative glycosyl transferase [Mycena rosella]|uniref:UDP-N-acetylglucosamine transferase subunit ALG13 n=1 Tax=Mycena rosella TaxID=1033263 RepID=A0AAD7M9M6_MYCRO|nr:putative glycosyl transferase [Mycena rosella]